VQGGAGYVPVIGRASRAVTIGREQAVMSLFSRARDILAAKANKALDSAENPDEMLDYSYEQLLEDITRVRQALVEIAAERKRVELQEPRLQDTIAHLEDQAQAALGQGRDDLAREALSRRAAARQQAGEMAAQHQELAGQEQKLQETLTQLQQRVNRFRSQKEVMKADYAVAQAGDPGGTGDALARAHDKIAAMQARAGATDELLQSGVLEDAGGHTDDIREELDEAAAAADVDSQLAALKAQLAACPAPPELPAGDSPPASPAKE
jgi:phage shock protein A